MGKNGDRKQHNLRVQPNREIGEPVVNQPQKRRRGHRMIEAGGGEPGPLIRPERYEGPERPEGPEV